MQIIGAGVLVSIVLFVAWQAWQQRTRNQVLLTTPESRNAYELTKGYYTDVF